jgi:hypothetical protein
VAVTDVTDWSQDGACKKNLWLTTTECMNKTL